MISQNIFMFILIICTFTTINCQRSPYAGVRPNGYKDRFENNPQNNAQTTQTIVNRFDSDPNYVQRPPFNMNNVVVAEPNFATIVRPTQPNNNFIPTNTLDNRFGGNNAGGQVQSLPHEAYGDKDLVDRYNREPVNNRPFWLVNQAAIEAQKGGSGLQNRQANANRQNLNTAGTNTQAAQPTQATAQRQTNNPNVGQLSQRFGSDPETQRNSEFTQNRGIPLPNQGKFPNGGLTNPDRIQQFAQYNGPNGYPGDFRRPNSLWQPDPLFVPHPGFF